MSDFVERLRALARIVLYDRAREGLTEAADEIERLRAASPPVSAGAGWRAGAEAMREACAQEIERRAREFWPERQENHLAAAIRALPLPPTPETSDA